jgi:hypothetical protein
MSMIALVNIVSRFMRDDFGRLAPVTYGLSAVRKRQLQNEERQQATISPMLMVGLIAALYVAIRIGVTYAAVKF